MRDPRRRRGNRRHVRSSAKATLLSLAALAAGPAGAAQAGVPTARSFSGLPTVGALFPTTLVPEHICTASVISSPRGNVLLTAAHCVIGTGVGFAFAPGFHDGVAPYGQWSVVAAHAAPGWVKAQDPLDDVAFLDVAPRRIDGRLTEIQQLTGANRLGSTARAGQRVTVPAYPLGAANDPITCTIPVFLTDGYPSFACNPYVDGTSGAPWLNGRGDRTVVGVLGGLHQGGCLPSVSYSPPLGPAAEEAYRAAVTDKGTDILPVPGSDGC